MSLIFIIFIISTTNSLPINLVQNAAENDFEKLDNYLPKIGDFPKFHYSTFGGSSEEMNMIEFKTSQKRISKSLGDVMDFVKDGASAGMGLLKEVGTLIITTIIPETTTEQETTTTPYESETTTEFFQSKDPLDPVLFDENDDKTNRTTRQEENDVEVDNDKNNDKEKESQESDEEEDQNMITGLLSAFLSGLSRPDGSVDVEAITGLLGSLSTQNPDGTYDFNGLTELLMSFFGGGDEEGGGSDFGAFLGGLAGAFIRGVAKPPGAKGSGIFVGNLLTGILPGLSGPAPTEEGQTEKPQPPLDSGGFLGGLLSTVLGSIGSLSTGSSGGTHTDHGGGGSKFSLFKAIFQFITSIFSSSSGGH